MPSKREVPRRPMGIKDTIVERLVGGKVRICRAHPNGKTHFGLEFTPKEWAKIVCHVSARGVIDHEDRFTAALRFHMEPS